MTGAARIVLLAALVMTLSLWASPPPASALSPTGIACSLTGFVSGAAGKLCTVATHAGRVISAGEKLAGGHVGGAIGALTGSGAVKRAATTAVGLAAIAAAVLGGAHYALKETAKVINATTSPNLRSTWFSGVYWRMAAVSALLTLPFLFAAAVQAMIRSDLGLLARSVFGYLPLGLLGVGIAAPLTMLLLAGSDEMSAIVSSASGNAGADFLDRAGALAGGVSAVSGDLFVMFFVGLLTTAATITLWLELLIRQAAVYVIVLMLPLFFAALVWPARRIWAARSVELLVALILSKFAIVSVLALGGAALGHTPPGPASLLTGATLVLLAACTPWALLRLLPLHELAGAAAGGLSAGRHSVIPPLNRADDGSDTAQQLAEEMSVRLPQLMRAGSDPGGTGGNDTVFPEAQVVGDPPGPAGGTGQAPVGGSPAAGGGSPAGGQAPAAAGGSPVGGQALVPTEGAAPAPGGPDAAGGPGFGPGAGGGERPPLDGVFAAGRSWRTLDLSGADDYGGDLLVDDGPDAGRDPGPGLDPDPRLDADPDPDSGPGRGRGLDPDPGREPSPGPGPDPDLEGGREPTPEPDPDAGLDRGLDE